MLFMRTRIARRVEIYPRLECSDARAGARALELLSQQRSPRAERR